MKSNMPYCVSVVIYFALQVSSSARAQVADAPDAKVANIPVNYTEAKVGACVLPDPLKLASGEPVRERQDLGRETPPGIARLLPERDLRKDSRNGAEGNLAGC